MKRNIFKIFTLTIGIIVCFFLYVNSTYFIKNQNWKYSAGTNIGDWLENGSAKINNRTIIGHRGNAKIVFCFGKKLIVENIQTGERGFYINKSN